MTNHKLRAKIRANALIAYYDLSETLAASFFLVSRTRHHKNTSDNQDSSGCTIGCRRIIFRSYQRTNISTRGSPISGSDGL